MTNVQVLRGPTSHLPFLPPVSTGRGQTTQPLPVTTDDFARVDLESGPEPARIELPQVGTTRPLRLRGGFDADVATVCAGSASALLAWAGCTLGFALPLAVGIENLIAEPSTFNPSGERNLGLGIAMVVCSVTVLPTAGALAGAALGAVACGGPILCFRR